MRDRSTQWIWNAYQAINHENLVKKVRNVSYHKDYVITVVKIGLMHDLTTSRD